MNKLAITKKGQAIITESIRLFDEVERRALQGFSEEELESLNDFVKRIRRNLEDHV